MTTTPSPGSSLKQQVELYGTLQTGVQRQASRAASPQPSKPQRIGIVGAGIVGASIAYHLAKNGAKVTIFEQAHPAAGATADSFAWINATFDKQPRAYFELNRLGILGYRHLEAQGLPLEVDWSGSIEWTRDEGAGKRLLLAAAKHRSWGYNIDSIDTRELRRLMPGLSSSLFDKDPLAAACYCPDEGSVDPVAATRILLSAAQEAGAVLRSPCKVHGIDRRKNGLRNLQTDQGSIGFDRLILAAGTATGRLAALAGFEVPLVDSPGVLLHFEADSALTDSPSRGRVLEKVALGPEAHIVQRRDGRIVAGGDFGGSEPEQASPEHLARLQNRVSSYFPALSGLGVAKVSTGWRPMPKDGYPIVGFAPRAPDIYTVVTHSGVTLAPVLGQLAYLEISKGLDMDLLQPFRPHRFSPSTQPASS